MSVSFVSTLKVLQELQQEINEYCDPNQKVVAMVERFIEIEESKLKLENQARQYEADAKADHITGQIPNV